MELDPDESSLAISRIERALGRMEKTLSLIVSRAPELPLGISVAATNASPPAEDPAV